MTDFLSCKNCIRWGLPWKLNHKLVLCSERKDPKGSLYSEDSEACKYFISKQTEVPDDLQTLRLFAQSLSVEQLKYIQYVATQALETLNAKDINGEYLSLGDLVSFEEDGNTFLGTVDGIDPQTRKICVFSQAHPKGSAMVESVVRCKSEQIKDLLGSKFEISEETRSSLKELLAKISFLRKRKHTLSSEEKTQLFEAEIAYANLNSKVKYHWGLTNK